MYKSRETSPFPKNKEDFFRMKKRIVCLLLAVLMVAVAFPIEAFAVTSIKGAYVGQQFGLVIDVINNSTSYSVEGKLPDGLKASGSYTKKNNNYALSLQLSGKPTTAGTYSFTIHYYKPAPNDNEVVKSVSYIMSVGQTPPFAFVKEGSLYIEKWPSKTEYYLYDTLDPTGLKVTVTAYKVSKVDGNTTTYEPFDYDVTDMCSITPTYFTQDDVAISCVVSCNLPVDSDGTIKTLTDTFRVTFKEADANTITGMELLSAPTKLTYTKGESLNTSGLTLRLKKYSGASEDITSGFTCEPTVLDTVGTQTVTVKYNDKTVTFDVTVTEAVASVPSSASSSAPAPSSSVSSSVPESSVPESSVSESEPVSESSESVSVPDPSSEPEVSSSEPETSSESEVVPTDSDNVGNNNKSGLPIWVWFVGGFLLIAGGAGIALFILARKKLDEE